MPNRHQKQTEDAPLNPEAVPFEEKQRELEGRRPSDRQEAFLHADETDNLGSLTPTDHYEAEPAAGVDDDLPDDPNRIELLVERELRDGETNDPFEAAEEGQTYVPPVDPPVTPADNQEKAQIGSGFAPSALDEPYDQEHHSQALPARDELTRRFYEALRADSSTAGYADQMHVIVRGSQVILRGRVTDLTDSDNLEAVVSRVAGVSEVVNKLEVQSLER
jgi:hypothetical protein